MELKEYCIQQNKMIEFEYITAKTIQYETHRQTQTDHNISGQWDKLVWRGSAEAEEDYLNK